LIISNNKALKLVGDLFGVPVRLPDFSPQHWTAGPKMTNNSNSIFASEAEMYSNMNAAVASTREPLDPSSWPNLDVRLLARRASFPTVRRAELNGADGLIEQRLDPLAIIELTKK
jgi:hypothetical protein